MSTSSSSSSSSSNSDSSSENEFPQDIPSGPPHNTSEINKIVNPSLSGVPMLSKSPILNPQQKAVEKSTHPILINIQDDPSKYKTSSEISPKVMTGFMQHNPPNNPNGGENMIPPALSCPLNISKEQQKKDQQTEKQVEKKNKIPSDDSESSSSSSSGSGINKKVDDLEIGTSNYKLSTLIAPKLIAGIIQRNPLSNCNEKKLPPILINTQEAKNTNNDTIPLEADASNYKIPTIIPPKVMAGIMQRNSSNNHNEKKIMMPPALSCPSNYKTDEQKKVLKIEKQEEIKKTPSDDSGSSSGKKFEKQEKGKNNSPLDDSGSSRSLGSADNKKKII